MSTLPCGRKKGTFSAKYEQKPLAWREILGRFLKEKKLRSTSQREKVAELIFSKKSHFDVQTLIKEVHQNYPEIGPATVYRTIKTLCEAGLLHESLQSHSGATLYEAFEESHHDHLICLDCGEIFEFHDVDLEETQSKTIRKLGFVEARHKHIIYAKCAYLTKKG